MRVVVGYGCIEKGAKMSERIAKRDCDLLTPQQMLERQAARVSAMEQRIRDNPSLRFTLANQLDFEQRLLKSYQLYMLGE